MKLPAQVKVLAPVESDQPSAASQVKLGPSSVDPAPIAARFVLAGTRFWVVAGNLR